MFHHQLAAVCCKVEVFKNHSESTRPSTSFDLSNRLNLLLIQVPAAPYMLVPRFGGVSVMADKSPIFETTKVPGRRMKV